MNNRDLQVFAWAPPHRAGRFCRLHSFSMEDWRSSGSGVDRRKASGRRIRRDTDNGNRVPCSSHNSSLAFWPVRPDVVQQRPIKVGLVVPWLEDPRLVATAGEPSVNWFHQLRLGANMPGPERRRGPGSNLRGITQSNNAFTPLSVLDSVATVPWEKSADWSVRKYQIPSR